MKKFYLSLLLTVLVSCLSMGQDTFSIVAVDPETGAVGGAGASCIDDDDCNGCGGVIIINGLIPGRGAMNSQAYACIPNVNLNLGLAQLNLGKSPQEALDFVVDNDQCSFLNNTYRQYGIVDLDSMGNPRSAAYTGENCDAYANHITGPNYAIQGNILLGQGILDSMEARFLATEGTLAEKLMAALQGANVPGADTRCLSEGVSSLSAFVRVAMPGDENGDYLLDLNVKSTPFGVEPIDSLQTLFDEWLLTDASEVPAEQSLFRVYPNPAHGMVIIEGYDGKQALNGEVEIYDSNGGLLLSRSLRQGRLVLPAGTFEQTGLYWYVIRNEQGSRLATGKFLYQN
jgi:uncharacterized Ntn-hydrolase superfamily protein